MTSHRSASGSYSSSSGASDSIIANGQVRRLCKELGIEDFEPMRGFGDYTFEFESTEVETLKYAVQDSPYCRAHE
jgi:hypothetical protein